MGSISFENATRVYGRGEAPAVDSLDLEIADGEFMVLVGPSGSGKTTALRMLAGLEPIDGGTIRIGGRDLDGVASKDRDIAMVFQNYALYPQKTVAENMGFALKMHRVPKAERVQRVEEAARLLGLETMLDRKPKALSGGQRQRVAMGRAIVRAPSVFLMDEPLSNLDAKLRVQTRSQIAELQHRLGVTTVYVTHDQVEAMTMGDRVAVLHNGSLQQCASPRDLYNDPANLFVAGFIGSPAMNLRQVALGEFGARLGGTWVQVPPMIRQAVERAGLPEVVLGIRPEHLAVEDLARGAEASAWTPTTGRPVPDPGEGTLDSPGHDSAAQGLLTRGLVGRVVLTEDLGADAYVHVRLPECDEPVIARTGGGLPPRLGRDVLLRFDPARVFVFDPATGERLTT
jgi:multiple sugar transport system ATP-binding protein